MEVIKYRRYRFEELDKTFFGDPVFFSRSASFRTGCPGRSDTVKAFLEEPFSAGATKYGVVIKAELQNQVAFVNECLSGLGYELSNEGSPVWEKTVRISCVWNAGSLGLLQSALSTMGRLVSELPVLLYESGQARRLRAYVDFLTSQDAAGFQVISRGAGTRVPPAAVRRAAQSPYVRRDFGWMEDAYCIAELSDRRWCAWVDGDEFFPLFSDERQAVRFLENRHVLFAV